MTYIKQCYKKFITENNLDYMYSNHTSQFVKYIENIEHLENRIVDIKSTHIKQSVIYYNEKGVIGTETTLDNYLNALKSFFSYLKKVGMAENIFNEIADYDVFRDKIKQLCTLKPTNQRGYIDKNIIEDLFAYFNNSQSKYANMKMMEFYFKITLLAPAKRKVIANLKISDFSENFKSVTVNNVVVKLPRALSNSICDELEKIGYILNADDLFFSIFFRGDSYSDTVFNPPFYYALKEIGYIKPRKIPSYPVEDIQNTGIVNLTNNGTSLQLISRISGLDKTSLVKKLEKFGVKGYVDDEDNETVNKLYNSQIAQVFYYQDI